MVSEVVWAESSRIGKPDGQICENGYETVCNRRSEGEVVANFVDGKKEVLVGGCTDYVCGEKIAGGQYGGRTKEVGAEEL